MLRNSLIRTLTPALLLSLLLLPQQAGAGATDIALFSQGGGGSAPPNITVVFDTSMSMRDQIVGAPTSDDTLKKWYNALDVLENLILSVNPPDGSGGYVQNARFGLWFYDKSRPSACPSCCPRPR